MLRPRGRTERVWSRVNDASSGGRLWIAIASYDPRFFRICQRYIAALDSRVIQCDLYRSGEELLAQLEQGLPYRAVLLDNALADMDALTFCRRLQALDLQCRPWLLLVPACDVEELDRLFQTGVQSWAPQISSLNSLLTDLKSLLEAASPSENALDRLLASWDTPARLVGRVYLREAVCLTLQYRSHFAIRKDILQEVGERHTLTELAIDSGIRRVIAAIEKRNTPAWQDFRQRHRLACGQKLTTGDFLYAVWEELTAPSPDPNRPSEGEPRPDERETQPIPVG